MRWTGPIGSNNPHEISTEELKQKIEGLKERKGRYEELLKELKASGEKQVSLTVLTVERWG